MVEKMRAIIKARPEPGFEMALVDIPQIGPDEVLLKVKATSICGSDLHIYHWNQWAESRIHLPIITGHEVCGEVVERGSQATNVSLGDLVSVESHVTCGTCHLCRTGRGHICHNVQIMGVDRDGTFAEYIAVPATNCWANPPGTPLELASIQENFGNAVHTAFATDVTARKVLITGCGPVGLMTIAVVKAAGARSVFATDISPYRLDLACKIGADLALHAVNDDVIGQIRDATDGEGVDVLLEMSGAPGAIRQGFILLRDGGAAALLGLPDAPVEFDLNNWVIFKGATVYGITGRRLWETWYQLRGLLRSGAVDLMPLVTHRFLLDDYDAALETMASGNSGKVVLFPQREDYEASLRQTAQTLALSCLR